jgi:uncharacterized protein (DUF2336 family)
MIVRKFFQWAQSVPAGQRADGASALARAYLYTALEPTDRYDAEVALTALLDDPSPLVRRALAESFASAAEAPHHLIVALANDQSDVSAIVLNRSPLLSDAELIDAAAVGDALAQSAIALRPCLSAPVAAALAEVGAREALITLAVNLGADLPEFSMRRMLERFGDDGELREALRSRPGLPPSLCNDIVVATAAALTNFVTECNWMGRERAERITREARERATVTIAATSSGEGTLNLVARLRASGALTAGLILRALLCGHTGLFEAALAELSGVSLDRVVGLVRERSGSGFAALYKKARLPKALLPAFRAALASAEEFGAALDPAEGAQLSLRMIERVLSACAAVNGGELDRLLALLRRLEAEAAREQARQWMSSQALPNAEPDWSQARLQSPAETPVSADLQSPLASEPEWIGVTDRYELEATASVTIERPDACAISSRAAEIDAMACQAIVEALDGSGWADDHRDIIVAEWVEAEPAFVEAVASESASAAVTPALTDLECAALEAAASETVALDWVAWKYVAAETAPSDAVSVDAASFTDAPIEAAPEPIADAMLAIIRADLRLEGVADGSVSDNPDDPNLDLFRRELLESRPTAVSMAA